MEGEPPGETLPFSAAARLQKHDADRAISAIQTAPEFGMADRVTYCERYWYEVSLTRPPTFLNVA